MSDLLNDTNKHTTKSRRETIPLNYKDFYKIYDINLYRKNLWSLWRPGSEFWINDRQIRYENDGPELYTVSAI
jgi:hypothetical protein